MFDWSLVFGNPFWFGSIPFALIGWLIAFIGQCIGDRSSFLWWVIFYNLFLMLGIVAVVATDNIRHYRLAVTAFIAVAIGYSTDVISAALAGSAIPALAAIAAGYIFMTIVFFTWVFVFGSSEESFIFAQLNSYSIAAKPTVSGLPSNNNGVGASQFSSQQGGIPMGTVGSGYVGSTPPTDYRAGEIPQVAAITQNAEYAYKAKALYTYSASQEDPNELSFDKGELLDIVDNKGKWWQARKADGTVGIAPSNYLQIL